MASILYGLYYTNHIIWTISHRLRGGLTFGLVKYVKEVSHVKHMHVNSLLVTPKFFFEINDHATQFVRKPTFDPLSN